VVEINGLWVLVLPLILQETANIIVYFTGTYSFGNTTHIVAVLTILIIQIFLSPNWIVAVIGSGLSKLEDLMLIKAGV
jgi:hypothetical protein